MVSANGREQVGSLRELRRAAGLTQEAVARRAACSTSYVRLLEAGYQPEVSDVLVRIAQALIPHNDVETAGNGLDAQGGRDGAHGTG